MRPDFANHVLRLVRNVYRYKVAQDTCLYEVEWLVVYCTINLYNYETQHLVNALRTHASTFE